MPKQINAHVQDLLKKEMSRKEFIATIGFGVASIFGLSSLLKLAGLQSPHKIQSGYGSSAYGGSSERKS